MNLLLDRLVNMLQSRVSAWVLAFAPVIAFFQVQLLGALLAFVVIDFFTGLWKAKLAAKISSHRFGDAIDRICFYLVIFALVHTLTLVIPIGMVAAIPETVIITGYLLKEALSIVENIRSIQVLRGKDTRIIDALVKRLGMDLDKLMGEVEHVKPSLPAPGVVPPPPAAGPHV